MRLHLAGDAFRRPAQMRRRHLQDLDDDAVPYSAVCRIWVSDTETEVTWLRADKCQKDAALDLLVRRGGNRRIVIVE